MRIHPLLSAFAASLLVLAPVHALAQDTQDSDREEAVSVRERPRPEYDAQGARLGGFTLNAALALEVSSTDNLFAGPPSAEFDDVVYAAAPTVRLSSNWSRNALALEAGGRFTSHEDFSNEDAESYYGRLSGRVDIGDSTNISGAVRAAHQVTPRTDPDSPTVGSPVEYDRLDALAGFRHRFARFIVSGDVGRSEYDYEDLSARDNEETFLRGRIEAEISPRLGLLAQASADEREYENTPTLDSEGRSYLVGATINGDLMRGEVSVGHFERDYAGLDTFDGLAVAGELEWYVTPLTTITLQGRRDADDQVGVNSGQPFITEQYGARVDHELLRNLILTAGVRLGERDYETVDRHDDYSAADVGADYLVNRRASLRFRYERDEVNSSGAAAYRDYEVNTVSLGLTLRL